MGFIRKVMKGFARSPLSSITNTTDTIAKHYVKLKKDQTQLSEKEIYREIIRFRYSVIPLKEEWRYEELMKEIDETSKLKDLVFHILTAESPDLLEAGTDNIIMTLEVIGERLEEQYNLK